MKDEIKEKFTDFLMLIYTIALDCFAIIVIGALLTGTKFVLEEWIFGVKIEEVKEHAMVVVYRISKFVLVIVFVTYVVTDIIPQFVKLVKRIKKEL